MDPKYRDVPDELWAAVAPLLPPEPPKPKGGRPRVPDRVALARLYVERFRPPRIADATAAMSEAVALNPNEVALRFRYADLLEATGDRAAAAVELERALDFNDRLNPDEPERLAPAEIDDVRARIAPAVAGIDHHQRPARHPCFRHLHIRQCGGKVHGHRSGASLAEGGAVAPARRSRAGRQHGRQQQA